MKYILTISFSILAFCGFSQTATQLNSWWTYSGNHKISTKNSLHTLYSFRRNGPIADWQQSLLRLGVNHKVNDNLILTPGYDWVVTFPYGEQPIGQKTTEHRITAQAIMKNNISSASINHRYRLEQRFIESSNEVLSRQRFRYRFTIDIPLYAFNNSDHTLFLTLFEEAFVNFGNEVGNHIFDQNWIYVGIGYKIDNSSNVKLGYMNQYLVKGDNEHRESNHTIQISFAKNFNLSNS